MNGEVTNGRSLGVILSEMRDELKEFVQTRIELFKREMREKSAVIKGAVPAALIGVAFLTTAFLLLSLALAALVAAGFGDSTYKWFFGFLIIGVFWSLAGGMALYMAKRRLTQQRLTPQKTVEVLSGDKAWLQNEARNAL